jgi:hypothetical protein
MGHPRATALRAIALTAFGSLPPPASARNNLWTHSLCARRGAARGVLLNHSEHSQHESDNSCGRLSPRHPISKLLVLRVEIDAAQIIGAAALSRVGQQTNGVDFTNDGDAGLHIVYAPNPIFGASQPTADHAAVLCV